MRRLRAWWLRALGAVAPRRRERDFAAEIESHLQLHVDDNLRAGMSPDEARRRAIVALGGVTQTCERQRDRIGLPAIDSLRQDVSCAARTLVKNPGFTLTAVVTLALGIGANSAIFSVVNAVLLRPLPYADPGRLVMIFGTDTRRSNRYDVSTYPDYADWNSQNRTFESMAAFTNRSTTVMAGSEAILVPGKRVTPNFFDVLGVQPALGRGFRPDEQMPGRSNVVIISDGFWKRQYGSASDVLGRTLHINDEPHTIVGVMPATFHVDRGGDDAFFAPLPIDPSRGHGFLRVVGRLAAGVTLQQAHADLSTIADRLARIYPRTNARVGVNLAWMTTGLAHEARSALLIMLGVVGVVLLIACANVAGLLLARGASRQRELAVRAALGAGRSRLTRQLLTESLLVAVAGGALGLLLADWTSRALAAVLAQQFRIPRVETTGTDASVLLFTIGLSLVTGIAFGIVPAFAATASGFIEALRDAGRTMTGSRAPRLRSGLVVLETALALVLLAGAGTLLKTFLALKSTTPGFETAHVLAADLWLPQPRFAQLAERARFYDAALARVQALPGVRSAAFVADLPLNGGTDSLGFHVVGRPDPPSGFFSAGFNIATAGYFATLGIPVRAGREFADTDGAGTPPVIVVNETAATTFWPGESALGHRIDLPGPNKTSIVLTVVGITGDVRHVGLGVPPRPEIFVSSMQALLAWPSVVLAVRTHGEPAQLADAVRRAVREVNPNVPIERINPLDDVVARSIVEPRIYTFLLGTFAALAVILAAIGLYGLVAYGVSQRTHELGVRVALGAERGEILRLVIGHGLRLSLLGAVIGLAGAMATTRLLVGLVKGIEPYDPVTLASVSVVLLLAALVASYLPARRAARLDPLVALRTD